MPSIEKRVAKDGTLSYRITVCDGTDSNGRKVRHRKHFIPDKNMSEKQAFKAAQKEAFLFEQQFEQGYSVDNDPFFRDYAGYVLQLKLSAGLKRSTYDRYEELLSRINESIGGMRLRTIRPMHLNQMYDKLSKPGVRGTGVKAVAIIDTVPLLNEKSLSRQQLAKQAGISPATVTEFCNQRPIMKQKAEQIAAVLGMNYSQIFRTEKNMKPLSTKTVLEYHRLTHTILAQAEKEMLVPYNAADKSTPPKAAQSEVNYFQPEQVRDILTALESEPLKWRVITHILMITGGRRGEVVGLEWSKIDFERKRLCFDSALLYSKEVGLYKGSTKTGNRRYVPLPEETLTLLKELQVAQKEQRLLMGDRWHENDYVFKQDDGQPMHPDSITQWLDKFSRRHDLPHINPHAFRHTAASVMIVNGADIVTISKMLGHAKVSTTEDIYSHVIEDSKQQAGNVLADVFYREKGKKQA